VAEREVERRLAASLAVKVVGYAHLMEADAGGTLPRLNSSKGCDKYGLGSMIRQRNTS
jgi:hypothetical protein